MAFHLYQSRSPREAVTKSWSYDISWDTYQSNTPCDILHPVVTVSDEFNQNPELMPNLNYARIDELNRYYFVDKIEIVADRLYRYYLSIDVLTTYADEIYAQRAIIRRQQNLHDLYLNDGSLRVENYPMIQTLEFSNQPLANYWYYVLAIAGGGS